MTPSVAELIEHPESLNKDTLFALRETVARNPYYQAARILFLKNLFLLHDSSFGEELRKAAIYVGNRRVLFNMVEGANYELHADKATRDEVADKTFSAGTDRTESLIDKFLRNDAPATSEDEEETPRRKPTVADAHNDYMAFLMQMDDAEPEEKKPTAKTTNTNRSETLIDSFIDNTSEGIVLQETPQFTPEVSQDNNQEESNEEDYFTETLAKIYIKQGRYEKAMEIIRKLNLNYPKKNRYFADQMRFLQKLVINQKHNK